MADKRLGTVISECCAIVRSSGEEFDERDVVQCLRNLHGDLVDEHARNLADVYLRRLVATQLKRDAGLDADDDGAQLAIPGLEQLPSNIPFYDGRKVRYIAWESAREEHLLSCLKLREDNIRFCIAKRDGVKAALAYLKTSGKNTLGEAAAAYA
jgi:hypothetical protein